MFIRLCTGVAYSQYNICMSTEFFRGGGVGKARDALTKANFLHLPPGKTKEKSWDKPVPIRWNCTPCISPGNEGLEIPVSRSIIPFSGIPAPLPPPPVPLGIVAKLQLTAVASSSWNRTRDQYRRLPLRALQNTCYICIQWLAGQCHRLS